MKLTAYEASAGTEQKLSPVPANQPLIESFSVGTAPVARNSGGTLFMSDQKPKTHKTCKCCASGKKRDWEKAMQNEVELIRLNRKLFKKQDDRIREDLKNGDL